MHRANDTAVEHSISHAETDPIRVLHVDDDPAFAELAETFLERDSTADPSLDVRTETDPTAVCERLDEVDCIVSDYDMPEVDGLELLAMVRRQEAELPFILFTGRGSEEIASQAISAGVTDYLRKGGGTDRFGVLANRIRNVVAKRRAEKSASRSHRLLRGVIDHLPQCVFVKDIDGRYLLINETGAETYGGVPQDIEGKTEDAVNDPETAVQFREEDRAVIERGVTTRIRDQYTIDTSGTERVEQVTKFPFTIDDVSKPAVLGIADEVTPERRQAAQLDAATDTISELQDVLDSITAAGVDDEGSSPPAFETFDALVSELETTLTEPNSVDITTVLQESHEDDT